MQCACGLLGSTVFFYIISQTANKKKIDHKICVLIFSTALILNISHSMKKLARYDQKCTLGFRVKCPLFFSDFNET